MNEDEAFIRAIVDNRGDDTARLIYADWLDDRADPRGPYLRAEHEWVKSGKKEKALRAMAATLDPVWVARTSRLPVGVCIEDAKLTECGPRITKANIDAFERRLGAKLPACYSAFLLNYNGGVLQRKSNAVELDREPLNLLPLVPISSGQRSLESWIAWHQRMLTDPTAYIEGRIDPATAAAHRDALPIGWFGPDNMFLWICGPHTGATCFYDTQGAPLTSINLLSARDMHQSFADFLAWYLRPRSTPAKPHLNDTVTPKDRI